jgi:predicted ArsR family transcriptional regulator
MLCHHPRSVAEVAATLSVPLGVARVLLGDMAELGLVTIHDTKPTGDGRPALALMERVLSGLRAL